MSKTVRRIITTAIVVIAIIALTVIMVVRTSATTRENSISHMKSIANEQTAMVRSFVENSKQTLYAYEAAGEVSNLLIDIYNNHPADPTRSYTPDEVKAEILVDKKLAAEAQAYTERYSATVTNPEGFWIGDWYTHALAHTDPGFVGITTRDVNKAPERLEELRNGMIQSPGYLFNIGIMLSPATGEQILSMYKAVMYNGQPIGFVGYGVFTQELASDLNSMELNSGGTTYAMINVKDNKYLFSSDNEMVASECTDNKVLELCEKYNGTTKDDDGNYENNGMITFYSYMGEEGWLLCINTPSSEVFKFSRTINANMIVFCTICIVLIIVFNVISIRQEETLQRLEQSKRKQAAITKNLHIAALKDILTDVNNRIKFIDDFGKDEAGNSKVEDCPNEPYCFAMFTISKFSEININYGHDVGDAALASTADILKEHFGAQNIYRTGSDEFVVAIKSPTSNTSSVLMDVNSALSDLSKPRKLGNDIVSLSYAAGLVKKGTAISPAVLITLKDIINKNGVSMDNNAVYVDMDTY